MNELIQKPATDNSKDKKIRILIVDDHLVVREGLKALLEQFDDLSICGSTGNPSEAMELVKELRPDMVIADISLGKASGIDMVRSMHRGYPKIKILVLSMHEESLCAERSLRAGASGYIMKSEGHVKIVDAIRHIMSGKTYISKYLHERLIQKMVDRTTGTSTLPEEILTDRELEVFRLLGQGQTSNEIAKHLGITIKTVQSYRNNIKTRLDIKNPTELIQKATLWSHSYQRVV